MNAYEIARAEATRVVEAAYRKAVAAGELPEGTILSGCGRDPEGFLQRRLGIHLCHAVRKAAAYGAAQDRGEHRSQPRPRGQLL